MTEGFFADSYGKEERVVPFSRLLGFAEKVRAELSDRELFATLWGENVN
ncbi:MAG TPA: hypothetical protein PKW52_06365 [Nitrospira sp.]|nr:hypothetical protein [Nitrospira sp.]HQR15693.1 hypothetical protein [Nitrospira sp.]HQV10942.1 hypothetical protein [Nitrospira sp.]